MEPSKTYAVDHVVDPRMIVGSIKLVDKETFGSSHEVFEKQYRHTSKDGHLQWTTDLLAFL